MAVVQSEFEDPEAELEHEHGHSPQLTAADRLYNQAMDSKARVREAAQRAIQVTQSKNDPLRLQALAFDAGGKCTGTSQAM